MKATELIKALENVVARHGDIEVICKMWENDYNEDLVYENNKDIGGMTIEELEKEYFDVSESRWRNSDPSLYLVLECNKNINTKTHDMNDFGYEEVCDLWEGE